MYHLTRDKLGFIIDSLEPSELNIHLTLASLEVHNLDIVLFFEKLGRSATDHLCSHMHIMEAYNFDGPLIATNLHNAYKLIQFPSPKPKFFFLNDMEWIRFPNKQFNTFETIYRNSELNLIARCEDHRKLMENCWNIKIDYVLPNYDFFGSDFLNYIKEKKNKAVKYTNEPVVYKDILDYL